LLPKTPKPHSSIILQVLKNKIRKFKQIINEI